MAAHHEGTTRFVRSPERAGQHAPLPFDSAHESRLPKVGDTIVDCELVSELGQGTAGHVYLAQQVTLSYRPLVLKFMPRDEIEHLALARLQHTNIMPLYWATDLPERSLRMLAMPYLAATNLLDLLDWSGNSRWLNGAASRRGRSCMKITKPCPSRFHCKPPTAR